MKKEVICVQCNTPKDVDCDCAMTFCRHDGALMLPFQLWLKEKRGEDDQ